MTHSAPFPAPSPAPSASVGSPGFSAAHGGAPSAADAGSWDLGDLRVHRIGFGSMRLSGSAAFDQAGREAPRDRGQAIAVLRRARDLGVNHVDTAAFYFSPLRSANELINSALSPYPDDLVVATKVGPGRDPSGEWTEWARPDQLRGQVEENLRQLGRDHLDLVNLRVLGNGPVAEHFGALADLREAGLVRHLGLSGVAVGHLDEVAGIAPVVCVQNRYALDLREPADDEVLRVCGERGIAFVPFFSVAGAGRHAGHRPEEGPELTAVARAHGASPAQVRLAWTLHRGPHVLVIPGTGDPEHLAANVAAGRLRLTDAEVASLDGAGGARP